MLTATETRETTQGKRGNCWNEPQKHTFEATANRECVAIGLWPFSEPSHNFLGTSEGGSGGGD